MEGPDPKRRRVQLPTPSLWNGAPSHSAHSHGVSLPPPPPSPRHHAQQQHHYTRPTEPPQPPPLQTTSFDDRRHRDPDPYHRASQDHRPPQSPSPAQPPYHHHTYSPRDPPVHMKKEYGDDTLPQLRRPPSNGNPVESPHGMPHNHQAPPPQPQLQHPQHTPHPPSQHPHHTPPQHPHHAPQHMSQHSQPQHMSQPPPPQHLSQPPPPQQSPLEDKRTMSFDSGPSPAMYRQPSYAPPQSPHPHSQNHTQPPYEQPPPMYGVQGAHSNQDAIHFAYQSSATKRKAQRASQACDNCRQLKAKCDESKPCKNCKDKNAECKYRDPAPKQQDKTHADVMDAITKLQEMVEHVLEGNKKLEHRMLMLEERSWRPQMAPNALTLQTIEPDSAPVRILGSPGPRTEPRPSVVASVEGPTPFLDEPMADAPAPNETEYNRSNEGPPPSGEQPEEETPEENPGDPVSPGKKAIPDRHTTGAGNLLKWPSVVALTADIVKKLGIKHVHEFPIAIEDARGLLRVHGRGEDGKKPIFGIETPNDVGFMATPASASEDLAPSPPSPFSDWGHIGGMNSGPFSPQDSALAPTETKPAVAPKRELNLKPNHFWKLVDSFKENMYKMHPFIPPSELQRILDEFMEYIQSSATLYQTHSRQNSQVPVAGFVASGAEEAPTLKRKRLSRADEGSPEEAESPMAASPKLPRHINTAVVLVILALGEACAHKERIPDVVPTTSEVIAAESPLSRNGIPPSPTRGTTPSTTPLGDSVTAGGIGNSWRTSVSGPQATRPAHSKLNMDVIPGLDYFSVATDIMGGHVAGKTLRHIYAFLLAGLYYGQMGRVIESHHHIWHACGKTVDHLRTHFQRLMIPPDEDLDIHFTDSPRDSRLLLIYWTCMQLESDIIAELPLLQSSISGYEQKLSWPNPALLAADGIDPKVIGCYISQMYLRKQLNKAHRIIYGPKVERLEYASLIKLVDGMLPSVIDKGWATSGLKFDDDEPPADNILDARLRAKYWGAVNIICRPVVKSILHLDSPLPEGTDGDDVLNERLDPTDPEVLLFAQRGIKALIESTRAFHNLKERRFIVTNIFGTATAQWGNLVTLATVYLNRHLQQFVNPEELRGLFDKTIDFLGIVAHRGSALEVQRRFLINTKDKLFPMNLEFPDHTLSRLPPMSSSFSSNSSSSGQHTMAPMSPVNAGPAPVQHVPPPPPYDNAPPFRHNGKLAQLLSPMPPMAQSPLPPTIQSPIPQPLIQSPMSPAMPPPLIQSQIPPMQSSMPPPPPNATTDHRPPYL